jgi:hypothetical protein
VVVNSAILQVEEDDQYESYSATLQQLIGESSIMQPRFRPEQSGHPRCACLEERMKFEGLTLIAKYRTEIEAGYSSSDA